MSKLPRTMIECAWGCGELRPDMDANCRKHRYIKGHWIRGKGNPHYKDGSRMPKPCSVCGKMLSGSASCKTGMCKSCSMKNLFSNPENNPNWKGGISFEPYPVEWKESLKEFIRERDGHICQICSVHQDDYWRKLDVHHIDYDKDNLLETNLISLCSSCHTTTNGSRDFWYVYLTGMIQAKDAA